LKDGAEEGKNWAGMKLIKGWSGGRKKLGKEEAN
jgi:hypothetical protein